MLQAALILCLAPAPARAAALAAPKAPISVISAIPPLGSAPVLPTRGPLQAVPALPAAYSAIPAELSPNENAPLSAVEPSAIPLSAAEALASPQESEALERSLPAAFDGSRDVRGEYEDFLRKLGFRDYSAKIAETLKSPNLAPLQRKVLTYNARRYRVMDAARELSAEVMAGVAAQGNSPESMERATELAARLISLQPLEPPSSLPAEISKKDKDGIVSWMIDVTVQKLGQHLASVVSDVVKTSASPGELSDEKALAKRALRVKGLVETLLLTAYTDAEAGQTRYAGRALAASLVRFSRLAGRPEVEETLRAKLRERDLFLENFVGDTLLLEDASAQGRLSRLQLKTGDFLGERRVGREASEIAFAVRPPGRLWLKALRQGIAGNVLGLWANPGAAPKLVPGRTWSNRAKFAVWKFRTWLSEKKFLRKGYSHIGLAEVAEADGVSMAWAIDNYPNSSEGGIRKIGIPEEFSQNGPFLRLGVARLDADKVWQAFAKQAAAGYRKVAYSAAGADWPARISPEEYAALAAIPEEKAETLLQLMNESAARVIEDMITTLGVGFAYGFSDELWRGYCSATLMLAHRMGNLFEIQSVQDRWHPLVLLMKRLGLGAAKEQKTDGRIIWPGSLFIDPKVALHRQVDYPPFKKVGLASDPYSTAAYVEMDHALTRRLASLLELSDEGSIQPDPELIDQAVRAHLDGRANKKSSPGLRSGATLSSGYSAGLEELLKRSDDD